jgi:hypothetical protein
MYKEVSMMNKKTSVRSVSNALNTIKFFIVTLMLAVTVGLWSIFSRQSQDDLSSPSGQKVEIASPAPSGIGLDLLPIPTLVPLESSGVMRYNQSVGLTPAAQSAPAQKQTIPPTPLFQHNPVERRPVTNTGSSR